MSDAGADQRERRRQQLQKKRSGPSMDPAKLRRLIPWAFVLLIAGAVIGGMVYTATQGDRCPGHWHSGFTVFVDDERVSFNPGIVNARTSYAPNSDIHADDGVFHFHPASGGCTPWEEALMKMGVQVQSDRLVMEEFHGHLAGTHQAGDGKVVKLFYTDLHGEWEEVTNFRSVLREQPPDGSAIMITYGELTEELIESQLARATRLEGGSYDPSRFQ